MTRRLHNNTLASLLCLALALGALDVMAATTALAAEPDIVTTAKLEHDNLYVGEFGKLVLTVKAPKDKAVSRELRTHPA